MEFMWICVGGSVGVAVSMFVMCLLGFIGDVYASWQNGRKLALLVTEKNHKRRVELLAKLIELQRAMQPVPSEKPVIESPGPLADELAGNCSDSNDKGCAPFTHTI
jgi:hypothetical protein